MKAQTTSFNAGQSSLKNHLFKGTVVKQFYSKEFLSDPTFMEGDDIAMAVYEGKLPSEGINCIDSELSSIEAEKVKEGDAICIIGYPGDKHGELFEMNGQISKIVKRSRGTLLLYRNIDTSNG